MNYFFYALIALCSYVIGSLSPAVYLSRKYAGCDIREMGSKNAGSTNVFRVMGAKWGVINFILDFLKGLLPALAGYILLGETGAIAAGVGVILGHSFPVFSKFKGGKSVASSTGILMALSPWMTLVAIAVAAVIIIITKYVSLASITMFTLYPVISLFVPSYSIEFKIFICILGAFILYMHRKNIVRLLHHSENPLYKRKAK